MTEVTKKEKIWYDRMEEYYAVDIYDAGNRQPVTYTIPRRYQNVQYLSSGAQGSVVKAFDEVTKTNVAIKKMHRPCCEKRIAKLALREFILLTSINHPNIIRLVDAFTPNTTIDNFEELYLVMELMDYSLHKVLQVKRLSHRELSFTVYQLLCAVNHLHNSEIIHRDLKPSNVVINEDFTLKVLDFGLARKRTYDPAMRMSSYVVTRYYRAPEVIFEIPYNEKVDIWSIGCIVAELLLHKVLFPGNSSIDQWTKIVGGLGTPPADFFSLLPVHVAAFLKNLPNFPRRSMEEIIPDRAFLSDTEIAPNLTAAMCRDLLTHMLCINPNERYSVADCLKHPYIKVWFKEEEVNLPASGNRYDEEIETNDKSLQEWKELLFEEVKGFRRGRASSRSTLV